MLYWLNGINAANWLYVSIVEGRSTPLKAGEKVRVPTGLSLFPRDLLLPPPRSWVERAYDVRYFRVFETGGHFPAVEQGPLQAAPAVGRVAEAEGRNRLPAQAAPL